MTPRRPQIAVTGGGHTGTLVYEVFDIGGAGRWVLRIGDELIAETAGLMPDQTDAATRWAVIELGNLNEPVRPHIVRAGPPWRKPTLTECGRRISDVAATITRTDALRIYRKDGARRAAYAMCFTCIDNANRWKDWDGQPSDTVARDFYNGRRPADLENELIALAALVRAHPDEFAALLRPAAHGAVDLSEARERRTRSPLRSV